MTRSLRRGRVTGLALAAALVAGAAGAQPVSPAAAALEGRLLAPCCWVQTLDIHESELARAMRSEVEARLAAGESAQAIEDDLAARHGERVRATPRGRDPRRAIPVAVGVAMAAAAGLLVRMLRRWQRQGQETGEARAAEALSAEDEARLEEELRAYGE